VDNSLHPAENASGNATGGGSNHILLQNAGVQADGTFNGYGILITSGTGAGQQRRIVDFDFSGHSAGERCAIIDGAWTTVPDSSSVYEITVGCDANSGADPLPGPGGPWRTIDHAMNAVAGAGSGTQHIFIKAGRAYLETATIDTARPAGNPVILEGYQVTPGDGGQAIIDGASERSYGITASVSGAVNYAFRNLAAVNCASNGFDLGSASAVRLVNCRADNNGGSGFNTAADTILVGCRAAGNASNGCACQVIGTSFANLLLGCEALGNGNQQFRGGSMLLVFCTAGQPADAKRVVGTTLSTDSAYLINCTIDGTGSTGATGFYLSGNSRYVVVNTIFNNLERGIQAAVPDDLRIARNNLFHNCPANVVNFPSSASDVLADPVFVDLLAGDLQLAIGSPALRAGYPPHVDIGSRQHSSRTPLGGPCRRGMQD
jgi:hypothetical protein